MNRRLGRVYSYLTYANGLRTSPTLASPPPLLYCSNHATSPAEHVTMTEACDVTMPRRGLRQSSVTVRPRLLADVTDTYV